MEAIDPVAQRCAKTAAGPTIPALLARNARTYPSLPALSTLGVPSRLEHWLVDLAAMHLGAIPCTAYATLSTDQLRYLGQHSAAKLLVLNGAPELAKWQPILDELPHLRSVITVEETPGSVPLREVAEVGGQAHAADPEAFGASWAAVRPEQPVTLLYTSGTTGTGRLCRRRPVRARA